MRQATAVWTIVGSQNGSKKGIRKRNNKTSSLADLYTWYSQFMTTSRLVPVCLLLCLDADLKNIRSASRQQIFFHYTWGRHTSSLADLWLKNSQVIAASILDPMNWYRIQTKDSSSTIPECVQADFQPGSCSLEILPAYKGAIQLVPMNQDCIQTKDSSSTIPEPIRASLGVVQLKSYQVIKGNQLDSNDSGLQTNKE